MPVAAPPEPPKPPTPKVTLTGITTLLGRKRALFKAQMPPKPPDPAHEQSFILAEGERDGDIELLAIDEKAGSIKITFSGTEMTVPFDKESNKMAGGAPGAPMPNPFAPQATAPANPFAPPASGGVGAGIQTIPTRTLLTPQTAESANPAGQPLGQALPQAAADSATAGLSPEESVLMSAANRLKREQEWRDQGRAVPHLPVHPSLQGLGLFDTPGQQPAPVVPPIR